MPFIRTAKMSASGRYWPPPIWAPMNSTSALIEATGSRVRTAQLRRDPRSTLLVFEPAWRALTVEATVTTLDGPDAPEMNLRLFQEMQRGMTPAPPPGHLLWEGQERSFDWAVFYCGGLNSSRGADRKDTRDEKADREHLRDPRRGYAGPGRCWRGRQWRLRVRWLVGELLGRADGTGHGRGDEHAVRHGPRPQDLRHHGRILAARPRGGRRQAIQRGHEVRRVAESSHAGVEQLGPDRGRRGRRPRGAQEGRWARAAGAWQREPDPDAVAPQPCRPVPPVGLPPRHRVGQTPVLGRHHPLRAEARRQQGLHHWSRDRYVRASRRDRHRIVRAGLTVRLAVATTTRPSAGLSWPVDDGGDRAHEQAFDGAPLVHRWGAQAVDVIFDHDVSRSDQAVGLPVEQQLSPPPAIDDAPERQGGPPVHVHRIPDQGHAWNPRDRMEDRRLHLGGQDVLEQGHLERAERGGVDRLRRQRTLVSQLVRCLWIPVL